MKHMLFTILEVCSKTDTLLHALSKYGVNGTIMPSTSLKHAILQGNETPTFVTLRHLMPTKFEDTTALVMIVDEEQLEDLKNEIRKISNNFKDIHGCMFSKKIDEFEGSF